MVNGADHLNNNTLISISGLEVGEKIKIPGDNITSAITKLWKQGLFADVNITIDKIVEDLVYLNIDLIEHSRLSKLNLTLPLLPRLLEVASQYLQWVARRK